MSKSKGKAPKSTPQKKPKKINQDLEEYLFQEDSDEELDETIKTLEMELKDKPKSSGKRKAPSINIKDYEVLEAEEAKSKKQKAAKEPQTNPRYVWNSSESACLKLLVLGSSPLGKNSASMSKKYLLKINRTSSLNTYIALTAALNKELDWTDTNHHIFDQKEVRNKLDSALFLNLKDTVPKAQEVPKKSAPLFDNRMIIFFLKK